MSALYTSCNLTQSLRNYGTMIPEDSIKPYVAERRRPSGWGARHTVIAMGFWGFAMSYAMRVNLSIAIVAMVKHNGSQPAPPTPYPHVNLSAPTLLENETHISELSLSSQNQPYLQGDDSGEFEWDEVEQGIILGSFFYGYMVTQLPGGILAQKYGGKWPLGIGILVTSILALLTPIMARTHVSLLILARIIQGLGEGLCTPAMHSLLGHWAPPTERGFMAGVTYSGTSFGTAATLVASGYIIHAGWFGGWPGVFYIFGGTSILWFIGWCFLVYDTPSAHPRISGAELLYIQGSIGTQVSQNKMSTPWKKIMTSIPVWVIVVAHTGHTWGLYTLLTELPTYMRTVLNFDIKQNSWMSALPYAVMGITAFIIPMSAEIFIKRSWLTTLSVRKICQIISHFFAGLALIGLSYSQNASVAVLCLVIAVGLNGGAFAGFGVNHVDIAANHAGLLMGITNTIANISGFAAPYVAGLLINGHSTPERWQIVFLITAVIYTVDTLIYLKWASCEEQPWNTETEEVESTPVVVPKIQIGSTEQLITTVPEEESDHHATISNGRS